MILNYAGGNSGPGKLPDVWDMGDTETRTEATLLHSFIFQCHFVLETPVGMYRQANLLRY